MRMNFTVRDSKFNRDINIEFEHKGEILSQVSQTIIIIYLNIFVILFFKLKTKLVKEGFWNLELEIIQLELNH